MGAGKGSQAPELIFLLCSQDRMETQNRTEGPLGPAPAWGWDADSPLLDLRLRKPL